MALVEARGHYYFSSNDIFLRVRLLHCQAILKAGQHSLIAELIVIEIVNHAQIIISINHN